MTRVTREDMVEQSVTDFLREQIFTVRGYPAARVELVDAFTENKFDTGPVTKNYLAIGFNFDDGGEAAELGSDLLRRTYTIEVWVIGMSAAEGRNLANAVRDSMEAETVPLKDVSDPAAPVIDYLIVDPVRSQRQPVPEPKPWQEFLWIVAIPVIDEYYARLV
jgi:hypothetical protein